MGCVKGAERQKGSTFPLEKQFVHNYICADCVQRKCVPRIRGLGHVARMVCVCLCMRVCFLCVCVSQPFVLQTREGCGRRGNFLLSQTLQRQAGLQLWDPLISATSGT